MRTSFITLLGLFASAMASPAMRRQLSVCSTGSPQCCSVDVLGVADLDCAARKLFPPPDFAALSPYKYSSLRHLTDRMQPPKLLPVSPILPIFALPSDRLTCAVIFPLYVSTVLDNLDLHTDQITSSLARLFFARLHKPAYTLEDQYNSSISIHF
jgi:hypothetical protein